MNRRQSLLVSILVLLVSTLAVAGGGSEAGQRISIDEALQLVSDGEAFFVDVRDGGSYADAHIDGAINVPLSGMRDAADELGADGRTIITYCACPAEESSIAAAEALVAAGVSDVMVLQGGITAWAGEGYPLKRGPRP